MKLTGAQITIKLLERQGIDRIIGIPGGANLPLYNALYDSSIVHVLARHEQAAGFMAQGITRSTGKAAVCFGTSGPGATNLITAIADAKLDSVPIVAITGQVPSGLIGTDAFQEVDMYGLTVPITKHNFLVRSVEELLFVIPEDFRIAQTGRTGPVLVDIPKDVQMKELEFQEWPEPFLIENHPVPSLDMGEMQKAAAMINEAKKPVFYIGGGVIQAEASEALNQLAEKTQIPLVSTLMGLGCMPTDHPLYLGMLGMHGARYTNFLLNEADLLIALGVRFDDRATGNIKKFCPNAKILHLDLDTSEINKNRQADHAVVGHISTILAELLPLVGQTDRAPWHETIADLKSRYPFIMPGSKDLFHPLNLIVQTAGLLNADDIIATDVGQHQMWVAQGYPFKKPRTLLTSGGLGTMGFGVPTAMGAAMANPGKKVVCFTGDGSILMNIQELVTLAEEGLNLTILLLNNGHLGLVRQQQELFYNQHYIASKFQKNPDFVAVAKGFGIEAFSLKDSKDPVADIKKALSIKGPCLVDIPIDFANNVLPIVPPGAGNHEMIGGIVDE